MKLEELQKHWDLFGKTTPFWAVLSVAEATDPAQFFATGQAEIDGVMADLEWRGLPSGRGLCLDFGCGIGRVTQALARYFDTVYGVDIAESMLDQARQFNHLGGHCRYVLNTTSDLAQFAEGTFDLVYSRLVLQHMEPQYAKQYIREFVRVLAAGGVAYFQVPSHYDTNTARALHLHDGAHRARIAVLDCPPRLGPGDPVDLKVSVTNDSSGLWPSEHRQATKLRVGNHWLDARGRMVIQDDGRSPLPDDLPPGASASIPLQVRAPARPGRYRLQVDMVEEAVTWFAERGSTPAEVEVRVQGRRQSWRSAMARLLHRDGGGDSGMLPVMELHGVPRDEVVAIAIESGAEVVDVTEDPCAGPGWASYRYILRKPTALQTAAAEELSIQGVSLPHAAAVEYIRVMGSVPGWFTPLDARLFVAIDQLQDVGGIRGHLFEIGAYKGRSAILLGFLARHDERVVVCDLFMEDGGTTAENVAENAHFYSDLGRSEFEGNYLQFHASSGCMGSTAFYREGAG